MKKYFLVYGFLIVLGFTRCLAQISPPGLGTAHTAEWFAIGIRQDLDTTKNKSWQSMSYIGLGRKSNPDNFDPFYKPAIIVINQEFYHQFHPHWQYSLALSYRRQDEYLEKPPYSHDNEPLEQEFRVYSRLSYLLQTSRIKFTPTLRQEFRKFYTTHFKNLDEILQLRSRFRLQVTFNLDAKKIHRLIAGSEYLFAVSKKTATNAWTNFKYRESRFSLYYSLSPPKIPLVFSMGYMNNIIGVSSPLSVHYAAFDVVFQNPFKRPKHRS
ncbi:DUF2490 domain-containing protein [Runella sp. MFBS21]|uniref:DUF2490 domain-containing protein n=1 Tax=Runella sp. MFBS21 TaxID=3034018 RepID=UPI0023F7179E|nr:DUF2490 domain-containing protein [Runella sp. MFBS21]MDF7817082.1 DUF2490 domain-containing protein [Runella sp. MFBS21]